MKRINFYPKEDGWYSYWMLLQSHDKIINHFLFDVYDRPRFWSLRTLVYLHEIMRN